MDGGLDALITADPAALSLDDCLDLLASLEAARAMLDAQTMRTLAVVSAEGDPEARAKEWMREEVACLLHIAPVTAAARLHDATELIELLPATFAQLSAGSITSMHARALLDAVRGMTAATITAVEAKTLLKAGQQTVGEFRQAIKRAVLAADPRTAETKHQDTVAQRRVRLFPDEHGTATLWAQLGADDAMTLYAALDAHAQVVRDVERTMDQTHADVLADLTTLALANAPGTRQGRKPSIGVAVALSTLTGADDQPGELTGYGPIPASIARQLAADPNGTWRRLITDPAGRLLDSRHDLPAAGRPARTPHHPRRHLHIPRLPPQRPHLRPRPRARVQRRRPHQRPEPRPDLPTPAPPETRNRPARRETVQWRHHLDQPHRPKL